MLRRKISLSARISIGVLLAKSQPTGERGPRTATECGIRKAERGIYEGREEEGR
ncbi:MAG: hypothetical protein WD851_12605 [Pirellulales bacterium]